MNWSITTWAPLAKSPNCACLLYTSGNVAVPPDRHCRSGRTGHRRLPWWRRLSAEQTWRTLYGFTVQKYVDNCAKEANTTIKVVDYVCFERGEGVEKKEDNFADEVASMMKKWKIFEKSIGIPEKPVIRAFRGFFAFKEKVHKLSQITVFSYKFGGFFGGKCSPKRHVKLCVILFRKSPDYYPQHKNSYPPNSKSFPQKI